MNYIPSEAENQFKNFLVENGFDVTSHNIVIGKSERCRVVGDKGKQKSGRYKFFMDEYANGWCINYKQGGEDAFVRWSYERTAEERREWGRKKREQEIAEGKAYQSEISEEEKAKIAEQLRLDEEERLRRIAEREEFFRKQREEDEAKAELVFEQVCDAIELEEYRYTMECYEHDYLNKKQVKAHNNLKVVMVDYQVENLLEEEGEPQFIESRHLFIPLYNIEGRMVTYQTISPDGAVKKFRLNGRKHAAFFIIGADSIDDLEECLYAEGYATGASIYEFTDKPVICCFDVGNLVAVLEVVKAQYPEKKHTICSDNDYYKYCKRLGEGDDKAKNVGLKTAVEMQERHGVTVVFPIFPKYDSSSDWNDLATRFSPEIAKRQFDFQISYMQEKGICMHEDESAMKTLCAEVFG